MEYFGSPRVLRLHESSGYVRQWTGMYSGHKTPSYESLDLSRTRRQIRARAGFPQPRKHPLWNREAPVHRMLRKRSLRRAVTRFDVELLRELAKMGKNWDFLFLIEDISNRRQIYIKIYFVSVLLDNFCYNLHFVTFYTICKKYIRKAYMPLNSLELLIFILGT